MIDFGCLAWESGELGTCALQLRFEEASHHQNAHAGKIHQTLQEHVADFGVSENSPGLNVQLKRFESSLFRALSVLL